MNEVRVKGPLFDGRAERVLQAYFDEAEREVADEGANMVENIMQPHSKSGRYVRSIQTDRQMDDSVVNDGGIIYGPWLEGVSSRNDSTRFKGYAQFRGAAQKLRYKAPGIAERVLRHGYLGRMQ